MAHYAPPAAFAAHDPAAAAAAQQPPAYTGYGAPTFGAPAAAAYGAYPAQQYPQYGAAPAYSNPDELRTIFLTGFPQDVRERELNNLLRFLPGYEASQLHMAGVKSAQAQGFALFDCGANAQNALRSIANLVFEEGAVLRCEMARKNMYIKDDAATKRSRYNDNHYGGSYGGYGGGGSSNYGGAAASPVQPHGAYSGANTKDNPPCNTLFIGNLGDGTDETELRTMFGSQSGFRQIKLNRGARGLTCFVEYDDVVNAMAVHQAQQGAILQSSDRGAVRIQYSRNPFGKKRDFNHYSGDGGGGGGSGAGRAASTIIPQAAAPQQAAENALPGAASEHTAAATAQFETVAQAQQQQQQQGEVQAGAPNTQQDGMTTPSEAQAEGQPTGDQAAFRTNAGGADAAQL